MSFWAGAIGTLLAGSHGHFYPRPPSIDPFVFRSMYDPAPMRERLQDLIDFGQLNSGRSGHSLSRPTPYQGNRSSSIPRTLESRWIT